LVGWSETRDGVLWTRARSVIPEQLGQKEGTMPRENVRGRQAQRAPTGGGHRRTRSGRARRSRAGPLVLGNDAAGTVIAAEARVRGFQPGDEVYRPGKNGIGTFTERVAIAEGDLAARACVGLERGPRPGRSSSSPSAPTGSIQSRSSLPSISAPPSPATANGSNTASCASSGPTRCRLPHPEFRATPGWPRPGAGQPRRGETGEASMCSPT